jgi:hypothetical protein
MNQHPVTMTNLLNLTHTTRNVTEFQAQVGAAMGPNQSLQGDSIEPTSHEHPSPNYSR